MTLEPEGRIRRWRVFLLAWKIHRWLGLGFAALIAVVSLSGGLLVMHPELERVWERDRHVIVPPLDPAAEVRAPVEEVLRRIAVHAPPDFRPLRLEPGKARDRTDKYVFISSDGANRRWSAYADPYTGRIVWRGDDQSLLRPWLLHLHESLHAGAIGYTLVGLASLALLLLGGTGVWITRDRWRLLFRNPFRRRTRGPRLIFSDVHKWVGLASLYFTLVLGGTGLWFAVLIVPGQLRAEPPPPLPPAFELDRLASVSSVMAKAREIFPNAELVRVIFPWNDRVGLQVRVLHREAPIWAKLSRIDFDATNGSIRAIHRAADAPPRVKLESILGPLHFGYYGSPLTRWLYVAGGFSPAILALTGLVIGWRRWQSQRAR